MILNGVNLDDAETHDIKYNAFPRIVKGRMAHIDGDIVAYQCSCVSKDKPKSFEEMKYNAQVLIETIKKLAGASRIKLHLTSSTGNKGGRYDIAMLKEYQANRKDRSNVPPMLAQMREWLTIEYKAVVYEDCEADDGMAMSQYSAIRRNRKNYSVICTLDKDLGMVPGLHLDWRTGIITRVKGFGSIWLEEKISKAGVKTKKLRGYGTKFFWAQMLMGDTVDNISGLPKIWNGVKFVACGGVTAFNTLKSCKNDKQARALIWEHYQSVVDNWLPLARRAYKHWKTGEGLTARVVFESEAKLLWMRRNRSDPDDVIKWMSKC